MNQPAADRHVRVSGGIKKDDGVFVEKFSAVCLERELASLMRRDWELCLQPCIRLQNTNSPCTFF